MAIYEVFSYSVTFKYKSTLCSKSTLFLITTTFLTGFLPLLIAYRSHGFWIKSANYQEQPSVHFKHDYLLYMETDKPDIPILCSTLPFTDEYNYCSVVKAREDDNNRDGKPDELLFEIQVSIPSNLAIYSVQLILIFDYVLQKQCLLQMESLAFLQYTSGISGCRLDVIGDLKFVQKQLLSTRGRNTQYNESIFDLTENTPKLLHLTEIIKEYGKRNLSTNIENAYYIWTRGELLDEPFIISTNILYPEETVIYRPNFWQVMKWAWIQYVAVLIIFQWVFRYVKWYVFSNHLVPAIKEIPWKKN